MGTVLLVVAIITIIFAIGVLIDRLDAKILAVAALVLAILVLLPGL